MKGLNNQKGSNALLVVIIVLLVVLLGGGGYYLYTTTNGKDDTSSDSSSSEDSDNSNSTNSTQKTAELVNVKDGQGTGTAVSKLVNGKYVLTITTKNLPKPEKGYQYVAWLEKKIPFSQVQAGALDEDDDGVYTLEFKPDNDYSTYRFVYVTLEPTKNDDSAPGEKVLDGNFL